MGVSFWENSYPNRFKNTKERKRKKNVTPIYKLQPFSK